MRVINKNTNNQQPADTSTNEDEEDYSSFTKSQFYMLQSGWMKTAIF